MALPTHVYTDHNAAVAAVTPIAPGAGTILTDDVALLAFETADQAITIPTPGTGWTTWTAVTGSPVTGVTGVDLTVFWARATQNDPTMPTSSDSGDHQVYCLSVYRGCITSGNPWDVTQASVQTTATTAGSATGSTTTVVDCLIVLFTTGGDAVYTNGTAEFSTFACTNATNPLERADRKSNAGNDGALASATAEMASAGAFGPFTYTQVTSDEHAHLVIAMKPPAAADAGLPPKTIARYGY